MKNPSDEFYTSNEDHFGFLVFDKSRVDTFFQNYTPVEFKNIKFKNAFARLLISDTTTSATDIFNLSKHSDRPTSSDHILATNVLKATSKEDGEKYFPESAKYLFFYDCLPDDLKYKWPQTRLGDFEFNVTFFSRLRTECKVFDKIIYGETGFWDKNIQLVFRDDILNEITAVNATLIKDCLIKDPTFADARLKADKDTFLWFLDQTIQNKWRLFLIDNN